MTRALKPRRIPLAGNCHLVLDPDGDRPDRYLVRFCGLDRDPSARAATQAVRVRQMMASLRGEAPYPLPLPGRVTIGWVDRAGWHCGRSPLAQALAEMESVRSCMAELDADLLLRVALIAAGGAQAPSRDDR